MFIKNQTIDKTGKDWSITNLFWLNLKRVYSTNTTRIVVILSPFFVTLALSVLAPFYLYIAVGQLFITTLSAGTIWGMTYFPFRSSTFKNNLYLTKTNTINIYISILMSMLFVTMCSQITFWTSSILFDFMNITSLAEIVFNAGSGEIGMVWMDIDWFSVAYTWGLSIGIIFLMSMSIKEFVNEEKTYFLILFIYLLLLLPFGGILNPRIENIDPNGMTLSRELNLASYIGLIFPQYHINTILFASISSGVSITNDGLTHTMGNIEKLDAFSLSDDWKWNMSVFYPGMLMLVMCAWIIFQKYIV